MEIISKIHPVIVTRRKWRLLLENYPPLSIEPRFSDRDNRYRKNNARVFLSRLSSLSPPLSAESLFVERRATEIGRDKRVHFPRSITEYNRVNHSGNYLLLLLEGRGRGGERKREGKEKEGRKEGKGGRRDNEGKIYGPVKKGKPQLRNYR